MSDCNCQKIGHSPTTYFDQLGGYRSGPCAPCSGDGSNCCVWHVIEPMTCDNCETGPEGDCPHREGANTQDYFYYKKTVSLGRISLTDKDGYKHVMAFDGPTPTYRTYELFAEVNYYTRPNKYCNRQSNDLSEDKFAFGESYIGPPFDTKHTGVYEKEPTLIFFLDQRYYAPTDSNSTPNKQGYFLAVDENDDFVIVGSGAGNGEVTQGVPVEFTDITASFPKVANVNSSDPDLNGYSAGDSQCDAPRPIIKFGAAQKISTTLVENSFWPEAAQDSCEGQGAFAGDTVWTDTSVYSGFDGWVKSQLTNGARLADLTDVFGADHTINEMTLGGYNISHKVNQDGSIELIYTGDVFSAPAVNTSDPSNDITGISGTGAFHHMNTYAPNEVPAIAGGRSGFYYIGSKYVHNDWAISMQGCMDLPELEVNPLENITEIYSRGNSYAGFPEFTLGYYGGNNSSYTSGHFEPHLNDAYREATGETLPDSTACQKIKNLYSGRRLELDGSLTGKMINLFARAYKDQYPDDFAGGQTTGDLVKWLTNPSAFYNVTLNNYENSRCCDGASTITGYNGVSCTNSLSGARVTPFGVGCIESGSKTIFFNGCTGVIRGLVSGDLYYNDTSPTGPADQASHRWNYALTVMSTGSNPSLGTVSGNTHEVGSGVLQNDDHWIKTETDAENRDGDYFPTYSGVFDYDVFIASSSTTPTGYYLVTCPNKHCTDNCYDLKNKSYRCDTGTNDGYNNTDGETGQMEYGSNKPTPWGSSGMSYVLNMFGLNNNSSSGCCGCQPTGKLQDCENTGYASYGYQFKLAWDGDYDWNISTTRTSPNVNSEDNPNSDHEFVSGLRDTFGANPTNRLLGSGWEYHSGDRKPVGIVTWGIDAPEFISGRHWESQNVTGDWEVNRHDIVINDFTDSCYPNIGGDPEKVTGTYTFKNLNVSGSETGYPLLITPTGISDLAPSLLPDNIAAQGPQVLLPNESYTWTSVGNINFTFVVDEIISGAVFNSGEAPIVPDEPPAAENPWYEGYGKGIRLDSHISAGVDFSSANQFYLNTESNTTAGIDSSIRFSCFSLNTGLLPSIGFAEFSAGTTHVFYDVLCGRWVYGAIRGYSWPKYYMYRGRGASNCYQGLPSSNYNDVIGWALQGGIRGLTGRWHVEGSSGYCTPGFLTSQVSNLDQVANQTQTTIGSNVYIFGDSSLNTTNNPMCSASDYGL